MYSIALVQNQSEMAHYSYADARPLLDGYSYRLFTGDNIGELPLMISRRQVNALVLGSNALNDRDIMRALCNPDFAQRLHGFLEAGRGVFCLQQIGLAMRKGPTLDVLPEPFGTLLPTVLPRDDTAITSGRLEFGSPAAPHVALIYPIVVEPELVRARACGFRSLPGLYWHYWEGVDLSDWDQLIVDPTEEKVRPLVLASKESKPGRIVASALPLDWQKQTDLFRNLLAYVVEGRHNLATINLSDSDLTIEYLRESLEARWLPFAQYTLPKDVSDAVRNVAVGIHSTLLIGSGGRLGELPTPLLATIEQAVLGGRLRVIELGDGSFGTRSMNVVSRELRPRRLLQATEAQIQAELRLGYIDDSFWSHVETLQAIEQMPNRTLTYGRLQDAAFAITQNHDRGGSYDEIFGATCAYYWLRATYLGVDSDEARETAAWLRRSLPDYEVHDRVLAHLVFAAMGQLTPAERVDLITIIDTLDVDVLSETQLLQHLRAALAANASPDQLVALALALVGRQRDGIWIDLTTTASAANALLDVLDVLQGRPEQAAAVAQIERSVRAAVLFILRVLAQSEASPEPHSYPWDGKARTTTKCLQAWLKFDSLQDLPVFELLENLGRADHDATRSASTQTALKVLQEAGEENARLRLENATQRHELNAASGAIRVRSSALVAASVAGYLLITLLIGLLIDTHWALGRAADIGFVSGWGFHSGLAGLLLGIVGLYLSLRRRHKGKEADRESESPD